MMSEIEGGLSAFPPSFASDLEGFVDLLLLPKTAGIARSKYIKIVWFINLSTCGTLRIWDK